MVDDSAQPITTSGPQLPQLPVSDAADESSVQQDVQQTLSSDDELWNRVDDDVTDDIVELVAPDADKPAPSFSAVATLRPPPAEAPSEASLKSSPHFPEVVEKLRNVFHLKAFRKNQLAAIISTLNGRDAIVLMPTGGGKSLCYQLPAVCRGGKTRGVTIVVTPLKALMEDQVARLRAERIDVMMFTSMDSQDGNSMQELRTAANKPSLVYTTPEKLCCSEGMKGILKDLHATRQLARFVIDEAHLINTWGRDFRSEGYAALYDLRTEYSGVPIVALTATATAEALQDIVTTLSLSDYVLLSQSFNRPNLRYKIIPKKRDVESNIIDFIKGNYPNQTGIIYCIARAKTEEVALRLREGGLEAKHFHAKVNPDDKKRIQQLWQNGECKIIVATVAFGMGVDKANVRFVIHFDLPSSIDAYCQETGRAGRDGEVADCVLYYNYSDTQRRMLQINKDTDISEEQKTRKRQALLTVNAFCLNEIDCRRMLILNHFTEAFDPADCDGTCDNCASTGEVEELDLTSSAILFVELIQDLRKGHMKITGPLSIHAFRGTSGADMSRRGFNTLNHFGKGSNISADLAKRLFDHLVARQILSTELEESQIPNRAPISYVYVCLIHPIIPVSLADSMPGTARAQRIRISLGKATFPIENTLHEESIRRTQVQESCCKPCSSCKPCSNDLSSEKTSTSRSCR
ncbi:P-loop containing nucleoside triphosphate hydrolase protein [Lactarius quietus]|nr:P-loop containing nucleoside triphosphate hydrolase protein [Lactarius quietus]